MAWHWQALRVISLGMVGFHVASGGVQIYLFAVGGSTSPGGIWANITLRTILAASFAYFAFTKCQTALLPNRRRVLNVW